ncbi:MAG: class I SAM-dependent methyltransferase [Pseudomonadota bacterium]|jgi:ubiquinone/menaquinone biosynthesis C-methylase UbiE
MEAGYQDKSSGYFTAARREMLPYVPADARIVLDVGCGEGHFGALVKQARGCKVIGIEHVTAVAEQARRRLDQVIVADIEEEIPLPDECVDCIVLNDVLEHLVDPWGALKRLRRLLRPGGHVVASIPNVRYYKVLKALIQNKTWEYTEKGVLDRTHLRFFTKRTIPPMFECAGLRIERLEGINGCRRYPPKYALLNWLTLGGLEDARYLQYACVARKPASGDAA